MPAQVILSAIRKRWPWLKHLFADSAHDRGTFADKAAGLDFVVDGGRRIDTGPASKGCPGAGSPNGLSAGYPDGVASSAITKPASICPKP